MRNHISVFGRVWRDHRRATIGGGVVLLLIFGVAYAAFVGRAPIKGGAASPPFNPVWTAGAVAPGAVDMSCTVSTAGGTMQLDIPSAFPGGSCTIDASVQLPGDNAEDGRIIGIDLTLPVDWTATLRATDCDKSLPRSGFSTEVQFTIRMGEAAETGTSTTFVGDGLLVRPLSSNAPLQCTKA